MTDFETTACVTAADDAAIHSALAALEVLAGSLQVSREVVIQIDSVLVGLRAKHPKGGNAYVNDRIDAYLRNSA